MCGRDVLDVKVDAVTSAFQLDHAPAEIAARYNISPGYGGAGAPFIVRLAQDAKRELITARWWLIPRFWTKPLSKLPTTFNARSEDIAEKPMFRDAFAKRRCLVPASGWYEFKGERGHKESYLFRIPDHPVFGFAGIYDEWISPDGEAVLSFAIATTRPSEKAATVHDRMPVVLHEADHARWLDPNNHDKAQLQALLQPWDGALSIYRASGYGNDPRHEGPQCVAPFDAPRDRDDGPLFRR